MKLSSYVVDKVFDLLIRSTIATKIHKDTKPISATDSEYIVINTTGMDAEYVQEGFLNINCHVKNLSGCVPNRIRLNSIANSVLSVIENAGFKIKDSNMTLLLQLRRSEQIPEKPELDEWYFNLFFKVTIHKN